MPSKQEKIREGVESRFREAGLTTTDAKNFAKATLKDLDSQGVVIKVERELPELPDYWLLSEGDWYHDENSNKRTLEDDLADVGVVAVEPLIEEKG